MNPLRQVVGLVLGCTTGCSHLGKKQSEAEGRRTKHGTRLKLWRVGTKGAAHTKHRVHWHTHRDESGRELGRRLLLQTSEAKHAHAVHACKRFVNRPKPTKWRQGKGTGGCERERKQ